MPRTQLSGRRRSIGRVLPCACEGVGARIMPSSTVTLRCIMARRRTTAPPRRLRYDADGDRWVGQRMSVPAAAMAQAVAALDQLCGAAARDQLCTEALWDIQGYSL